MRRTTRAKTRPDVRLRLDPNSAERILISACTRENPNRESGAETSGLAPRYRRRTTSLKGRRQAEKRRASLPAFYKLNIKPKTARKNLLQKIGSCLAKLGDDLVRRNAAGSFRGRAEDNVEKIYARQLAEVGDYLNTLYSSEDYRLRCSESYHASVAESCLVLTSILIGLKNENVVVVSAGDLNTLSSLCRVHRAKSLSRARR